MAKYKNPLDDWLKELPEKAELSRRAWLEIKYTPAGEDEEKDISEDVSKYLISMSYTDNLSDAHLGRQGAALDGRLVSRGRRQHA